MKQIQLLVSSLVIAFFLQYTAPLCAKSSRAELPLVVVVCSYNNALWVEKNLDSIFMQQYDNFRVIYIDDASQDETAQLVANYLSKHGLEDKVTLIANKVRTRKTKNIYNAFHSCDDDEIIVIVDGDDWLSHKNVFSSINEAYQSGDVWLTWGQFLMSDKMNLGWGKPVPEHLIASNDFREFTWVYGAPRSFYAWLFKQIKLEDFVGLTVNGFQGKFYPSSDDFAMMYPMLEMAHNHIAFLPEVAYIVNQYNPLSTSHAKPADPVVSMQTACEVKMYKKRYTPLEAPITHVVKKLETSSADIIIISTSSERTSHLLKALDKHVKHTGSMVVVHNGSYQGKNGIALPSEKDALLNALAALPHDHIFLLDDTVTIINDIDCRQGIIDLEKTGALGCYYHVNPSILSEHAIPCEHIRNTLHAWKIYCDKNHLIEEYGCNMALYRKKDLLTLIESIADATIIDFKNSMPKRTANIHALGLCYADASVKGHLQEPASYRDHINCFVDTFDQAMYVTEKRKTIYEEILAVRKEADFVRLLRNRYSDFLQNPPYSVVPKIPKIMHHIWLGGPMPEQYVQWRKKWQAMHPDWISLLWTDKEVANLHLENQEYYDETTSYGEKANLLRYELLYQFGGLYVDTDCECFKPFDFLHHCCDFYAGCEYPQRSWSGNKVMIGNSIMASRPGHPLVAKFIKNIEKTWHEELQVARSGTRYATDIIKRMLARLDDTVMIFPANMFYPWAIDREPGSKEPITNQDTFVQPETWSLHYWHYSWNAKSAAQKDEQKDTVMRDHAKKNGSKEPTRSPRQKSEKKRVLKKHTLREV